MSHGADRGSSRAGGGPATLHPGDEPAQGWGPSVERTGRRRGGRLFLGTLALLLVVALIAAALLALWASSRIPRVEIDGLASGGRPLHILVAGSDSREGLSRGERNELSTGSAPGDRADTLFVLSLDGDDAAMLAFPRDLWVTRCDGSVGRINSATSIGGPACLVDTVRELSGLDIHHYVGVTFGGFRDIVDAVGGVRICLEEAIVDRDAGIDLPAGCQVLGGADALGYVRVRKIDDDFQRIRRQQRFLQALAAQMSSAGMLTQPWRAVNLLREAGDAVEVDAGMGVVGLARVALGLRTLASGDVPSFTVPGTPRITSAGAWVLDVDHAQADPLFASFRTGEALRRTADAPTEIDPADIEVTVLNGAGVEGLARRTADELEAAGFVVAGLGNADRRDRTLVVHPPGRAAAALAVASRLGLGTDRTEETPTVSRVVVLLGADQGGAT